MVGHHVLHQTDFIFVLNSIICVNILIMFKMVDDFSEGVTPEMTESAVLLKSLIMTLINISIKL